MDQALKVRGSGKARYTLQFQKELKGTGASVELSGKGHTVSVWNYGGMDPDAFFRAVNSASERKRYGEAKYHEVNVDQHTNTAGNSGTSASTRVQRAGGRRSVLPPGFRNRLSAAHNAAFGDLAVKPGSVEEYIHKTVGTVPDFSDRSKVGLRLSDGQGHWILKTGQLTKNIRSSFGTHAEFVRQYLEQYHKKTGKPIPEGKASDVTTAVMKANGLVKVQVREHSLGVDFRLDGPMSKHQYDAIMREADQSKRGWD